jgi:hypothetical protein
MKDESVIVDVVFRSASGRSLLEDERKMEVRDFALYAATEETRKQALQELRRLGFEIVGPATVFGVSVSGSLQLVREVFGEGELTVPDSLTRWIEAVRIPPRGEYYHDQEPGFRESVKDA